uniref:TAP-C domain-containing protein n=3 Tax=Clastoptera arizonana TaxID=38151 RepID=A0A1B6E508_9HEMI
MHRRVYAHRSWNEHDDRDTERKVSFKNQLSKKSRRQKGWDSKIRAALLDEDDVDMIAHTQHFSGRNKNYVRGLGRRGGQRMSRDSPVPRVRKLQESAGHWYKVVIQKASKYEKQYLYQTILNYIKPTPLIPYGFSKSSDDVVFFVDNYETGQKLLSADKKITANDGWKLSIHVRPNFPNINMDETIKERIKLVMSKRYNVHNKALNLTKFHADPDFMKADLLIALNRPHILTEVVRIIAESIPDIMALDLSDNNLSIIEPLRTLAEKAPNFKILHLGKNMFRSVHYFEVLKALTIEELVLDNNPLCNKYSNQDVYVRDVRKRFPKLIKLDDCVLPREISFDLEETHKLKPSQGSFLCDPSGGEIVRQFLEQYYTLYDSNSRAPLVDAYRENALFSLTSTNANSLSAYASDSRNLYHTPRGKNGLLRRGRESIIAFIESLPQTQHDPTSFAVDLSFFTPKLLILSICGVFREVGLKLPIRAFNRTFIIVPTGSGFCIVNDLLHITIATSEQAKDQFKTTADTPTPSTPNAAVQSASVISPVVVSPEAEISRRQQMVSSFAMQSGMNIIWAEKCLNETNWDYDRALFVFAELQKQGTIPAEAFVK